MKAALFRGPGSIEIGDVPTPSTGPGEVLVEVKVAGICGSDLEIYRGRRFVKAPLILGHEAAGIVSKVGEGAKDIEIGDRVVIEPNFGCGNCAYCRTGHSNICPNKISLGVNADGVFAEFVKVPRNYLWKIPEGMGFDEAALIEPLAVVLHAMRAVNILPGDNVLTIGGGPIGALATLALQSMSANVAIQEASRSRIDLLRRIGLKKVLGVSAGELEGLIENFFDGERADVVIDTVGVEASMAQAFKAVRPGGKILVVGLGAMEAKILLQQMVRQEIELIGSIIYVDNFREALKIVRKGIIPIKGLITHRFPLTKIQQGFEVSLRQEGLKVLIDL